MDFNDIVIMIQHNVVYIILTYNAQYGTKLRL